ncbi:hypothetical protein [Streptomyces sp. NPDC059171]|uniref:hypothetical protein n=1 Tax=Streptomyces sp. NPDC059171 TaxID=3346755 RepID=UPI0036C8EA2E
MPTFETCPRFTTDLQHLTPAQRRRFRRVVLDAFVPDLRTGRQFRPGLREARPAGTRHLPSRTSSRRGVGRRWGSPGCRQCPGRGSVRGGLAGIATP